ncbi:homoserine kinase [Jeotgalibaca ciconiae]|uniref:Homoserine kinase n=1 Tax=Jeotgalibaca ciconiae TaxID=2496265 RepID=A0A3Q9BLL0_9LACT|nr:homoserine kinase [Jeotgalibaca ciconiae]AZP05069.1 homoserine kinase [Jeotgalibaca ciconiae]HJB23713.1 homoserine kinase [Candidatus Jeotgalibaca pullicola]
MTVIKVPATSANLGPGFDSIGIAVSLYLELEIVEQAAEWFIEHSVGESIPSDEKNLIIQTALEVADDLTPHHVKMRSDIPPARGLGSSSAAIVAGIELANHLAGLNLSEDEKVQIATRIEGHPDNVMPAIAGNLTFGTIIDSNVIWTKVPFPKTRLIVTVPSRELLTSESRAVMPKNLSLQEAIKGSSIANVMVSALHLGDIDTAGKLMEEDVFHEPYRESLIPELTKIREITHEEGGYGTYLSGAGTTVMTLAKEEVSENILNRIQSEFPDCDVFLTTIDTMGSRVE